MAIANVTSSPLSWPLGWPRTPEDQRKTSTFGKWNARPTVASGQVELGNELELMGVDPDDVVISTNLALRLDGQPRSGQPEPADPGVAVYWIDAEGTEHVLACDRYYRVGCNLRAIVKHINALRGIARWGCGDLKQAFRGYTALPDQAGGHAWWEVLDLDGPTTNADAIRSAYRCMAQTCHPDKGGAIDDWHELQAAMKQAIEYVKAQGGEAGAA